MIKGLDYQPPVVMNWVQVAELLWNRTGWYWTILVSRVWPDAEIC